nr:ATP-binding cassette domain-containing protein [Shouchella clausii]
MKALSEIHLNIEKGDIFGVIGHSGAGKSTLLRTVNMLERPTAGDVIVDGKVLTKLSAKEVRRVQRKIGMIFQHFNLLDSKNVFDNVAMPLKLARTPKDELIQRVDEQLAFVGLSDKRSSYPSQLSGGQKQRVAIARALAARPHILLCDEATSALDPKTTSSILDLLKRVNKEYNITILLITHEMKVIKQTCNRVAVMEDGRIVETDSLLNLFSRPKSKAGREFVQSVLRDEFPPNLLAAEQSDEMSKLIKMEILGEASGQNLLSQVSKQFAVESYVKFGNVFELQGVPFGHLFVELKGTPTEIRRAERYIADQNAAVQEVI